MKFLMFIACVLFGIWFAGLVLRATLSRWLRRRTEEYQRAAERARRAERTRRSREGDVTIETQGDAARKKVNRAVGEYVDFEETKE